MANEVFLSPSLAVQNLVPQLDEDSFLNFLKAYYEWLQSTKITFTGKVGNFSVGETIIGDDSKAKAIVKEKGTDFLVIKMLTDRPFDLKETFEGQTSGAIARVTEVKDNIIRAAARIQKNRDDNTSVDKYFEYLKLEFNKGFPTVTEVDRRLIANKLKEFYQSKSNEDAYRFLFRAVYGLDIEFRYPGEEVLRVSDGDFEKTILIRAEPTDTIFSYLNQTIVGQTSGALGNVVDIKITFLGGLRYAELILKLTSGTFTAGETIELLDDPTETTTIYGMVTGTDIVDAGSGYAVGDVLTITGDGSEAEAEVSSISTGPINKIVVNAVGHGYRVGTEATVVNTGTGGTGFAVKVDEIVNPYTFTRGANTFTVGEVSKVSIISRGSDYFKAPTITLDDVAVKSLGLLSENLITIVSGGTNYAVGDTLVFTGGAGANAAGIVASVGSVAPYGTESLLFEDGTNVLQDGDVNGKSSVLKNEDWANLGAIRRVELTNFGDNYTALGLPTITVTSGAGASANLVATDIQGNSANVAVDVANNAIGLGAIRAITIKNFGIDYTSATIDTSTTGDGNANVQAVISGLAVSDGVFLTDDGKISVKILQDSLFYQDFSYVIRSGLVFNAYKELVKQSIHPAGLQFFGEILISSYILASAQFNSVVSTEREEIEVIIKQILAFFPGSVNPITLEMEKNLELEIATTTNQYREINVEIAPLVIDQKITVDYTSSRIQTTLEIYLDATLGVYTDVMVMESIATVEIDVVTELQTIVTDRREINVEISPLRIDQKAEFLPPQGIDRYIVKEIDLAIDAPITERQIHITLGEQHGTSPIHARLDFRLDQEIPFEVPQQSETFEDYSPLVMAPRILGRQQYGEVLQNKIDVKIKSQANETLSVQSSSSRYDRVLELFLDATMGFYSQITLESHSAVSEVDIVTTVATTSSTNREIEVEYASGSSVSYAGASSVIVKRFEILVDATMAFYTQVSTQPGVVVTEIDIVSTVATTSSQNREIEVEFTPFSSVTHSNVSSVIVKRFEIFADATMAFYSQVAAEAGGIQVTEIDIVTSVPTTASVGREIELDVVPEKTSVSSTLATASYNNIITLTKDIGITSVTEYETDITLFQTVTNAYSTALEIELAPASINTPAVSSATEIVNRIESGNHVVSVNSSTSAKIDLAPQLQINNFNQFDVNDVTFAELNPYTLSSFPISTYSSNAISDTWESYGTVKKNLKVSGTVTLSGNTVIGTGTSFDVDFGADKFIIVNGEKFKVANVANSTYLTVNVNPVGTYTNVSAYKEVFV